MRVRSRGVGGRRGGIRIDTWLLCTGSLALLLGGCGAKTGLQVPEPSDANVDARTGRDASVDAPRLDAPRPFDAAILPDGSRPDSAPQPTVCIELSDDEVTTLWVVTVARVQSADVVFLVDTTGSMRDEIGRIQDTLASVIIPRISDLFVDVAFGVGEFSDYPFGPYGVREVDTEYRTAASLSTDPRDAVAGVNRLAIRAGGDLAESHVVALQSVMNAPLGCDRDICFRRGRTPLVLVITDAPFHNGPDGDLPYSRGVGAPTYESVLSQLRNRGVHVFGLYSGAPGQRAERHLLQIAHDTGAVDSEGQALLFNVGLGGERLDEGVLSLLETFVAQTPFERVSGNAEDVDGDRLDASLLVSGVDAEQATPPSGATIVGDDFVNVQPGTTLRFAVRLVPAPRDIAPPGRYPVDIVIRAGGSEIERLRIEIVVTGGAEVCP